MYGTRFAATSVSRTNSRPTRSIRGFGLQSAIIAAIINGRQYRNSNRDHSEDLVSRGIWPYLSSVPADHSFKLAEIGQLTCYE
jgi:hypothetical protein